MVPLVLIGCGNVTSVVAFLLHNLTAYDEKRGR